MVPVRKFCFDKTQNLFIVCLTKIHSDAAFFNCNDVGDLSKSNHSCGPKCLSCDTFGHKSMDCHCTTQIENSTAYDGINTVHVLLSLVNMCKGIFISNNIFLELVDTGSPLALLKHSSWIKLEAPSLSNSTHVLTLLDFFCTKILGSFSSEITTDNQIFPVNISVNCMHYDLILGCDVIK